MKIARLCKDRYPKALVVAGGPHIPKDAIGFFSEHPYVDLIVHGEGELAFRGILRENLASTPDWSAIPGVSYLQGDVTVTVPQERLLAEEFTASPYLGGYLDRSIALCKALGLPVWAPWETNRGCPYACSFCDWGSATMSRIRKFDLDRLYHEIDFFAEKEIPFVHINDANFGMLPRDKEIAHKLLAVRRHQGYPQKVVVNFAKNSSNRVFAIGQAWSREDFLSDGITLSMQATDSEVLRAIGRENIRVSRYQELQMRYVQEAISTYTELIVGLPRETAKSFREGLGTVLEMGNHSDIRVYDLLLLPNAPMSDPDTVSRYGLRTVQKQLYAVPADTDPDEIELGTTVVETNTMSRAELKDCLVYGRMLIALHCGCYTRYLAIHLRREYELPYHVFYRRLQQHFAARPLTVLGMTLAALSAYIDRCYEEQGSPRLDLMGSPPEAMAMLDSDSVRNSSGSQSPLSPEDWLWICIFSRVDSFYSDLPGFLLTLGLELKDEIPEVLRFQRDMMLDPSYDPSEGKVCRYTYDFPSYFRTEGTLQTQSTVVYFRDTFDAAPAFPRKGHIETFAAAAIRARRPHYQHRLEEARIVYTEPA